VLSTINGEFELFLDLRSRTEFVPFYTGAYDGKIISQLVSLFDENWIVLDVGANIGFYAVPFARKIQTLNGRLLCFEPVPENYDRLRENLQLNNLDRECVQTYRFALSNTAGKLQIILREDFKSGGGTGNASVFIDDQADGEFKAIQVEAIRLDDFVQENLHGRIDFIKVDIEGHEDLFFEGADAVLRRDRPIVFSEFNEDYYRRRGVMLDIWMRGFVTKYNYLFARPGLDGIWVSIDTLVSRRNTDDVLLIPKEKANAVLKILNRASSCGAP